MADYLNVVARMRALQRGQAIPIVSQRQLVIQPHALIITMISMAGEDTSVHGVAIGRFGGAPRIRIVADPRRRDDQYELLRSLLPDIESYFAHCLNEGTFPQLWVSSDGALGHLDTLADRLRFTDDPEVKRLGVLWTYAGERSPIAGQQALISATSVLRAHYATGQQESEDEHLGALLTWIEPPPGRDILTSVALAEKQPMGAKTDPWFDANKLQPAVELFNQARKANDSIAVQFHEARIRQLLEEVIRPIYTATQRAIGILQASRWKQNPVLNQLAEQESTEFVRFMAARAEGHLLPYRDSPKAGAFKIVSRERAVANVEAGSVRYDRAARERAVDGGKVLRATLIERHKVKVAPRLFEYPVILTSHQSGLHLRSGDILWSLDSPRLSIRIVDVERRGPFSWITAVAEEGKTSVMGLTVGTALDFGPKSPNWGDAVREFKQMGIRLASQPWTHSETMPQSSPLQLGRPNDLLSAVEGLV